jgi:lysine-N-methylase
VVNLSLPILTLAVREQKYSCHGCGNCCRDFTVQLREDDLRKLREQGWEEELGEPVTVTFRGQTFLRQREDGACMFLLDNGLCRIHAKFGFEKKPIACQLFPFHLSPSGQGVQAGINFACQSVLENKGVELRSHQAELMRMAGQFQELSQRFGPPMLADQLRAEDEEVAALRAHVDAWLSERAHDFTVRLDGLAWVAHSLALAQLGGVRRSRFAELLHVLFGALPEELTFRPVPPASRRQKKMLRQAVFARTEDPKLRTIEQLGRFRTTLRQLGRNRRFRLGKGAAPQIGADWPGDVAMLSVERIGPATDAREIEAIDDLMTRYLRASVLGGRAWGNGYYGWPMVRGLGALLINVAAVGWLARLHAAGAGRERINLEDVRAALGRVDRTAGRARWLGSVSERLRLKYLSMDEGLRALLRAYALVEEEVGD